MNKLKIPKVITPYLHPYPPKASLDSGMVTNYVPAQRTKPKSVWQWVQNLYTSTYKHIDPRKTTEQGSGVASPAVYQFALYSLRYERRAEITECNQMWRDDLRCQRSIDMYVREAIRKGVWITVDSNNTEKGRNKKVLTIAQEVETIINSEDKLEGWGRGFLLDGDLFIQKIIDPINRKLIDAKRLPADSMERNSNDQDEFDDVERAFSQVDVNTNAEVATYPEALIWHGRWAYTEPNKYGNSTLVAVRRVRRLLEMEEEAQVRRRIARATQRKLWNIGTAEKPSNQAAVENFRENNGLVTGTTEQYDPVNVGLDYFANGLVSCSILEGDTTVHEIEDIKYFQDLYLAGLPTPAVLFNLASKDINRDILQDQRAQWLLETQTLTEKLSRLVRDIMDTALLVQGIDPQTVTYTVHFSESSIETPTDIINRVLLLFNNGHGQANSFTWAPLITWERAIQMIAEFVDIDNVKAEYLLIQKMLKDPNFGQAAIAKLNQAKASPPLVKKAIKDEEFQNSIYNSDEEVAGAFTGPGQPVANLWATNGEPAEMPAEDY